VIEVKKKSLFTVVALTTVLLATSYIEIAYSKASTDVLFYVSMQGFGGTSEYRQAGNSNNWILYSSTFGDLEGGIVGTMSAEAHWIWHFEDEWVGPEEDPFMLAAPPSSGNGGSVLTVVPDTVMGTPVSGTLTLKFVTRGNEFTGTWVIKGGTGDLKGVTGQGTWFIDPTYGQFGGQAFEGKIHFNP
jgi:hypothetical protein